MNNFLAERHNLSLHIGFEGLRKAAFQNLCKTALLPISLPQNMQPECCISSLETMTQGREEADCPIQCSVNHETAPSELH